MFRRVVFFSFVLMGSLISLSCEKSQELPDGPPRIHFTNTKQDLGEIPIAPEGRDIIFSFLNRGLSELRISQLVSSCGCAGADINNSVLAPGEEGIVVVRIAPHQSENRSASVTVHSNDPSRPRIPLRISWRAVAPLEFNPLSLDFGTIRPNETLEKTVKLIWRDDADVSCRVGRVQCFPAERLRVSIESAEAEVDVRRKSESFIVSLTAPSVAGIQSGRIEVFLDNCWRKSVSIPVSWHVQDVIEAKPGRLFLGTGYAGETRTQKIIISSHPGEFLEIDETGFQEMIPGMSISCKRLGSNRIIVDVEWILPESAGRHTSEIVFRCKQPKQQTLTVPVSVYIFKQQDGSLLELEK